MKKVIIKIFKTIFMLLIIWFLLCQLHVIYHYAITIYRNEWIVGRTMEEIEERYGKPGSRLYKLSLYSRPDCLNGNLPEGFFINALRIIPFYPDEKYYMVFYDDEGIAYWAGYGNAYLDDEDFFEVY